MEHKKTNKPLCTSTHGTCKTGGERSGRSCRWDEREKDEGGSAIWNPNCLVSTIHNEFEDFG